jgi:hypothetical protein
MKIIPKLLLAKLLDNGKRQDPVRGTDGEIDFEPVVKLFTPDASATWLFTEAEETEDGDILLFGLADLGFGTPELGAASLREIEHLRGRLGLAVERDLYWMPNGPLSAYADAARIAGHIVEPAKLKPAEPTQ